MVDDTRLLSDRFPRASQYHPEWVLANASGGANSLWLTEWLDRRRWTCGPACGCWTSAAGGPRRRSSCGASSACRSGPPTCGSAPRRTSSASGMPASRTACSRSTPTPGRCRSPPDFFDAIVCIDSFPYYGTDDLYLNYLAQFVKPGGPIGIAGAGLVQEIDGPVPDHLREWWTQDLLGLPFGGVVAAALGADRHRGRRGGRHDAGRLATLARLAPGGRARTTPRRSRRWRPMRGRYLGYVRVVGRRRGEAKLEEYCWPDTLRSFPAVTRRSRCCAVKKLIAGRPYAAPLKAAPSFNGAAVVQAPWQSAARPPVQGSKERPIA